MTNENEIMEQLAQVEDGDFVRILYSKQEDIITMRAGYARGIKNHEDCSTTFHLYADYHSPESQLIRVRQNFFLDIRTNEILKIQVQKRSSEDAKKLEGLLGTTNDKK
ncbi:MAG: hypothetical protein AABX26_01315 [Nanoarchaeota archaeon]